MRGTPGVVCTENGRLVAKFDNHCTEYVDEGKNKVSTEFNYAVSCHKAQGSEADHVMFVLEDSVCAPLHKRNLLYTAMTRAKKTLTIVGPMDVLHYMVANDPEKRCTTIHVSVVAVYAPYGRRIEPSGSLLETQSSLPF
jgi:ATP-dependent exoDNAse (exonuclease V) alpha subunit